MARRTIATPLRHFSNPQNKYKQILWTLAQSGSESVKKGRTRSQAKLIWGIVDSEAFREVIWGWVSLEREGMWGLGIYITKLDSESVSLTTWMEVTLI